jgi:hypothetical protein
VALPWFQSFKSTGFVDSRFSGPRPRDAQYAVEREPQTVARRRWIAFGANHGALPAIDEKAGQEIRGHFRFDLPLRLGERDQSRNLIAPDPDSCGDLLCESRGKCRSLGRQRTNQ